MGTEVCFTRGWLDVNKYDFLHCYHNNGTSSSVVEMKYVESADDDEIQQGLHPRPNRPIPLIVSSRKVGSPIAVQL